MTRTATNPARPRGRLRGASVVWAGAAIALLLAGSCRADASGPARADCRATHCILFVGNSLTYVNDLPGAVAALADSARAGTTAVGAVVAGGVSLEDHWNAGDAQREIATGRWDVVVLQQGPSARADSRVLLREYVARYAAVIRKAGAAPALYMPWPARANIADFPASSESWRLAAADVSATLFAVGDAWRAAWRRDSTIALYADDGLHPAPAATYLAALVIVAQLYHRPAAGLPARLRLASGAVIEVPAATAAVLQAAADEVNAAGGPPPAR